MRTATVRWLAFGFIVFSVATLALLVPTQQSQAQIAALPAMKDDSPPTKELLNEKITFPENKETKKQFEAVGDYLAQKEVKWDLVCRLVQGMLDAKSDYFYQYEDGDKRRVSVKDEVNRIIGKFSPEGKTFYQNTYGGTADNILKAAKETGLDKSKLAEVAQRFFHTKAGAEAGLLLAAINLETGNYPEAAYGYRRMLARTDADTILDPKSLFRAAVALRRANEGKQTDEIATVWDKLEKKYPRDGLTFGRKGFTLDQLKVELERPVELLFGSVGSQYVAMKGGDATRTGLADAGIPFLGPILQEPVLYNSVTADQKIAVEKVNNWITAAYKDKRIKTPLIPAFFPVTAPNMIVFRGYDGVYAFYTKNFTDSTGVKHVEGEQAWFSPSEFGAATIENPSLQVLSDSSVDSTNQRMWIERWKNDPVAPSPGILFENPLAGTLSHDGKRVYYVDDFNVPPPINNFDPNMGGQPMQTARSSKSEYNRLIAIDLETGMLQWRLGGPPTGNTDADENTMGSSELTMGSYFLGPPVTVNGKLYVLFEKDGAIKLACLDAYKVATIEADAAKGEKPRASAKQPELVWVQNLGRANTGIRQDTDARRSQGVFLATADGVMVCPTNTGAYVAVDLNARSLLWAHTYVAPEKNPNAGSGDMPGRRFVRPAGGGTGAAIVANRWRSSMPIIVGNRVIATSFDSGFVECLDLRSGKVIWRDARKPKDLYVGGVINGHVLIVGQDEVRAIKLVGEKDERTKLEKVASPWDANPKFAQVIGHGVTGRDGIYYLPVFGDPDKPTDPNALPSVISIDAVTGKFKGAPTVYRRKEGAVATADARLALGNLVFHDGMMFSQSATEIVGFPLNEAKQKEIATLLSANPHDPDGLVSRGELVLEAGKLQDAIKDFKQAETNKPSEATQRKIKQKLYVAYTELLRNDFPSAEGVLNEYKALCEGQPNKDDIDYARQLDEQIRRKGLMYSLVAKGREAQGRLVDAFDNYRAYAELGEVGKLMPVPEDPNTLALSSVWASERIDAMMKNAKDATLRKPLEDKVAKEFAEIKEGNDLNRLRNFVKVFGPYFASGREAQYLFAEKLNSTNDDGNRREAQSLLLTLMGLAEDDKDTENIARSTESLARLLTSRGMTDDSLGLYSGLAARYPKTVVRDGKTGADLLGELITDKRYLSSLESGVMTRMTDYTATVLASGASRGPSTNLVTSADAFPFFRRYRVTIEGDLSNGMPTIVVTDRISGLEKTKSEALIKQNIYAYNYNSQSPNSGMNNQRLAQSSGHLLLVQHYHKVICFDLSKDIKKTGEGRLWEVDLMGPNAPMPQNGQQWQYQFEPDKCGELLVTPYYYDNITGQQRMETPMRIGRSMVLQSNYATVLTKEAIITREPRTGQILWQRQAPALKSMIFGDSRYVYLVEPTAAGSVSRVLRAVDGVEVKNVPNFGPLVFDNPNRLHLEGRQVLVFEELKDGDKKSKVLRQHDFLAAKDVWKKEFPADAVAFETIDPKIAGVLETNGTITVINTTTGDVLQTMKTDADKAKDHLLDTNNKFAIVKPLLLADEERFYVFLNRGIGNNNVEANVGGSSPIRARYVNGVLYGFNRADGKRLYHNNGDFYNMRLLIERFDEVPCMVATNPMFNEDPNQPVGRGTVGTGSKLVAIDKATGGLRHSKLTAGNNQWLNSFSYNQKDGAFEYSSNGSQFFRVGPPVKK
jgi:tetratricopeptide (TPR) repeat protein/outer membrane protein assembly factor BamB